MPLSPRDIDYFLEVSRCGQLAVAAGNLAVTPAALSKAIRRLESELGLPLFERSGQGMSPTPFGRSFVERAQRLKHEHDEALRHAGEVRAGRAGLLRLGATIAALETVVSQALAELQPRRPGLHAAVTVGTSDELLERTRQGRVDAAIIPVYDAPAPGLDAEWLGSDALVPAVREGHPLLRQRALKLQRLSACGWVLPQIPSAARAQFDAAFQAAGLTPPTACVEVDYNSSWSLSLVAQTDLLSLVPKAILARPGNPGVRELQVDGLSLERRIMLFTRPDSPRSPLMQDFVLALKQRAGRGRRGAR